MGISGLLPSLKEIQRHGNISEFKGKRLAVDAYVWLHKGAFGCAEELVKGKKTTKFVDYAMYRVRLLRHHGIEPYVVFDGGPLPAKKKTESSREKSRADNLTRARSLESQGRFRDARDAYTKCVDITPEMAYQLIKALRAESVDYVVAPYEADAQLCFLEREGYVDGIITEDSDLLVFGCKQVIFKLEGNGQCVSINSDDLAMVREMPMHGWTIIQFRRMAMLSGCDYLDSIPGVGLKTAHRLLRRHKTVEKVVQMIRLEGTLNVPTEYIKSFAQAELAFIHQRVFNPASKKLIPLNDFAEGGMTEEDEKWVGLDLDVEVARGIARGDLHPETRLPIEDMCPDYQPQARGNVQKIVTAPATAKVAGPMDAFISRSKIPKPLPVPVGKLGPGVSRLSERNINTSLHSTPRATATKKSKFFGSKPASTEEVVQLVWHSSDPPSPVNVAGPSRSLSPSPVPSVGSPTKAVDAEESFNHLTSPIAPATSSPAMSSPPHAETLTSPRRPPSNRSRSATPLSPTQPSRQALPNILIPSTSQLPNISQTPKHTPIPSSPIPPHPPALGTSTYSNYPSSSDSIDIEEVVTPSLPEYCRQPRPSSRESLGKRQRSDENVVPEDEERATKTKSITKDWRLKYAFGGANTPSVRPAKKVAGAEATPTARARTPVPLSATIPRILSVKPVNIPDTPLKSAAATKHSDTPNLARKSASDSKVELVQASSSPMSDGSARLGRYMFTGKVDTRQTSSPAL